jgi:hypothetical protein
MPLSLRVSFRRNPSRDSLPLGQSVFDVVQGGVDQDTTIVPCSGLDPDGLVDQSALHKRLVGDGDS